MTGLRIEISKFAVVGAGNFVLTFVIFALLLNKLHVNHIVSLGTAWLFEPISTGRQEMESIRCCSKGRLMTRWGERSLRDEPPSRDTWW